MPHVLVFAKTPYAKTPYDRWLAGSGVVPVILTTTEFAAGYGHLPHVHAFDDYDTNQLVEKTALRLAREHAVTAVFARAEADVVRAAQLRDLLDLPGQRTASALAFRDKVVMKDHLVGGPVEIPAYRPLDSAYTALEFVAEHGYPVVIKPLSESGSLGAAIIRDEAELDAYLARPWRGASEIEVFVPGQMYHVDGLVVNGEVVFAHPFRYLNDCLSFRANDWVANLPLTPQDPVHDRLLKAARAVLAELPTPPHTAFHAELWITPDDRTVFCEIASRTGGGMISSMVRHAFGIDLDKEWLYAECGLPSTLGTPAYRPTGALCIPPSNGVLSRLPSGDEPACVKEVALTGTVGQEFHGGVKSGLFLAGYVVGGDTEEDVAANLEHVAAWFADRAEWSPAPTGGTR
ncbi:ATP-dependent carboxylate-amine ligase [Streptomyces sp. Je 1-4]|uniref:ATP-grasp domain-containing protein n=1 Tax=Streptomyces TaxID=1883 RepID=UPI0021DAE714|nr:MULTISPECIES: ATP-dependent carboxylate-amine ligase [unclassified Streptomyces]UYB37857.1 ATP-dependent carboxylate-amine ligase [Streptomyces sp. Je 1-4]UZQ33779.1 ATP-dependent carboxylate-amine ligase [Streptomyces sp. Je 1-4] [Streptomyces sp. Je 1-4 4N24]UZQ41197.1 ATP-dependent carboxylate-amine ligase [Streptomyces sp. Je 1-4] [Streptomyces sp. Je 1-4 4N24_ara]